METGKLKQGKFPFQFNQLNSWIFHGDACHVFWNTNAIKGETLNEHIPDKINYKYLLKTKFIMTNVVLPIATKQKWVNCD